MIGSYRDLNNIIHVIRRCTHGYDATDYVMECGVMRMIRDGEKLGQRAPTCLGCVVACLSIR